MGMSEEDSNFWSCPILEEELLTDDYAINHILDEPSYPYENYCPVPGQKSASPVWQESETREGVDHMAELEDFLLRSVGLENVPVALEQIKIGDSFTAPPQERGLPPDLQAELIQLYFETTHVLCPVVKKSNFIFWYHQLRNVDYNSPQHVVLKAIIFAGFAHVNESQLRRSPYTSVPQAQRACFAAAQAAYHTQSLTYRGHRTMIQSALILSFWTPYDGFKEVNCFWIDEALRHVNSGSLSRVERGYSTVMWWCCLVRNRVVSAGLRRAQRLRNVPSGWMPCLSDFETSLETPVTIPASSRNNDQDCEIFILMCQLSDTMKTVLELHAKEPQQQDWKESRRRSSTTMKDMGDVISVNARLKAWKEEFDEFVARTDLNNLRRSQKVHLHTLEILHLSTIIMLYEPFTSRRLYSTPITEHLHDISILKIQQSSHRIAKQVGHLMEQTQAEDLPMILMAWLLLPMAIYLVEIYVTTKFQGKDKARSNNPDFHELMRFLRVMMYRFDGIMFVSKVIETIMANIVTSIRRHDDDANTTSTQATLVGIQIVDGFLEALKAQLFDSVAKLVRYSLADGIIPVGRI